MIKKLMTGAAVALTLGGAALATATPASAQHWGGGYRGGYRGGVYVNAYPAPVYYNRPAVVYAQPAPVYYSQPAPVYYGAPAVVVEAGRGGYYRGYYDHRGYDRGYYRR